MVNSPFNLKITLYLHVERLEQLKGRLLSAVRVEQFRVQLVLVDVEPCDRQHCLPLGTHHGNIGVSHDFLVRKNSFAGLLVVLVLEKVKVALL